MKCAFKRKCIDEFIYHIKNQDINQYTIDANSARPGVFSIKAVEKKRKNDTLLP